MLALVCGTGQLPAAVAAAQETRPLICMLAGFPPDGLMPDVEFRLEKLGQLLRDLKERGVSDVCFCGAITRPAMDPVLIDDRTAPLLPTLQRAMAEGDDAALRAVISLFETEGFTIRAAESLAPDVLPPASIPTRAAPRLGTHADVDIAVQALVEMGARDVGQSCIVRAGQVEAMEAQDGTDAMLRRHAARGLIEGVLFKAPKPGQDRRADLPTIGPGTAQGAVAAGLDGIVIEAGGVIVIDLPQIVQILDAAERFLWIRAP